MRIVQIECDNPKCKRIFEVSYGQRCRKYCSVSCASSVTMSNINKRQKSRERSRQHMIALNKEHQNDPEFRQSCREAASQSLKEQWNDQEFRREQSRRAREEMKKNWENPAFRQARVQDLVNYNNTSEKAERSRDQILKLWKDETFQQMRKEFGRRQFKERNKIDGYNYPKAQKVLFDSLLPFIPDLIWEHEFVLSIYLNGFYFLRRRLDIVYLPLKIDIEVDGWSHEEEADIARDKALIAKGWTVIRVTNEDVLNNRKRILYDILDLIIKKENRGTDEDYLQGRKFVGVRRESASAWM